MPLVTLLLFSLVVASLSAVMTSADVNATRAATQLMKLYSSTNGPTWTLTSPSCESTFTTTTSGQQQPWGNVSTPICSWFGVQCNNDGVVTGVMLRNCSLSGTLPDSIISDGVTVALRELRLPNNAIGGTLPASYGDDGLLQVLDINKNSLTGTLPAQWSKMSSLTYVDLGTNSISGTLPPSFSSWTTLTLFAVGDNKLTGTLPPEYSTWTAVTVFLVYSNSFTGTLPSTWSLWTKMINFNVCSNSISGTLPPSFGRWSALDTFGVGGNQLSGTLPPEYSAWAHLTVFWVYSNSFTGTLPLIWAWDCHIQTFIISHNPLIFGTLPEALAECKNMTFFDTSSVSLSGTIPPSYFEAWAGIQHFLVRTANLSGTIPAAAARWVDIVRFDIGENQFSGNIQFSETWRNLNYFHVGDNKQLSGTLHSGFALNAGLQSFFVRNCSFYGTLDPGLAACTMLIELHVQNNRFTGTLPAAYAAWRSLQQFFTHNNAFSGTLPNEYASWGPSIMEVNVGNNSITGTLPTAWSAWSNLQNIVCYDNSLSGELQPSWSKLTHAATLAFDRNKLTGTLPRSWGSLVKLEVLSISFNNLSGPLPSEWASLSRLQFLGVQNNSNVNGSIPQPWSAGRQTFLIMSACGTTVSGPPNGVTCFLCLENGVDFASFREKQNQAEQFSKCSFTLPTAAPGPTNTTSSDSPHLYWGAAAGTATTQTVRDSLGVSIVGSTAAAAIAGDPSSAQMLITLLLSTCMCSDGSGGALSSSSDEDVFAAVVTSLTLSPFASLGPAAMAFGNSGLVCAAFVAQLLLVVLLGRRRGGGGGRRRDREEIAADARPATGHHDAGGATVLDLVASRWRALCVSPAAVAARFPNVAVVCGVFLVPGMVRGAVVVLGTAGSRGALEVAGAVVSVAVLCVFLVAVLEWLVYRTVVLEDVARSAGGAAAGGGVLREDEPLHFEAYATPHPFTPPVPALVAAAAMSRGGAWVPAGKRNSFGRLVAALGPSHTRWWAVPPAMTVLTTLLSSLPTTSTGGCDALQGVIGAACFAAAVAFVAVRPYRAVGASAVAAYSLVVVGATAVLGLACRHDALRLGQVLSICSALSYVSLVGRVYVMALPFVEQRLLEGQSHAQSRKSHRALSADGFQCFAPRPSDGQLHRMSRRRQNGRRAMMSDETTTALAQLIETICARTLVGDK